MRLHKIPLFITAFITIIIIIINHFLTGKFWQGWELVPAMLQGCFCEHNYMERFIRQPFNTWSNIAFLYAGILILYQSFYGAFNNENYISRQKTIGIFYGILLCILFTGSFLFHASLTKLFGNTDMIGTYGIPLFLCMIGLSRISVYHNFLKERTAAILCVSGTYVIGYLLAFNYIIFINMIVTFGSLLLIAGATAFYLVTRNNIQFDKKLLFINCVLVVTACVLWILDHNKAVCFENSFIQLHSFWHVLNAMAAYYMLEFFRSEHL